MGLYNWEVISPQGYNFQTSELAYDINRISKYNLSTLYTGLMVYAILNLAYLKKHVFVLRSTCIMYVI